MIIYHKEITKRLSFTDHDDGSMTITQDGYCLQDCVRLNEAECMDLYKFLSVKFGAR